MSSILKNITMAALEPSLLRSKFRGSLLGALIGDCTGSPYEGETITAGEKIIIQRYFDKLEEPNLNLKTPFRAYTDDTAMTKSVAKFLIDKPEPDYGFLARLFVNDYFKEPRRGYGQNVVDVFHKLKTSKFEDVFKPAAEQFMGSGSYGNGGAMRIAPIGLYYHNNYKIMIKVATQSTKITHTHLLGINGALLQCMAVQQALMLDPQKKLDPRHFCLELYLKMKEVEKTEEDGEDESDFTSRAYQEKLKVVERLLGKPHDDNLDDEVIRNLGHGISAYESVPTAIYCFLKTQNESCGIMTDNLLRRTIQYAITLGGDTDTIASMAGAIAGAYLGEDAVNSSIAKHCESYKEIAELADNLFEARGGSLVSE
ncbi:unnamed protein product [Phaedon cochleariae]|uniref:ADP-ribosylhydrolase ARH3 n=1 Tax=Phaedon cochleariae TaxID=80249 RepID=A0A9P0GSA0_PHACE|nr:unnamed protein product [Phaedon cochleariae]